MMPHVGPMIRQYNVLTWKYQACEFVLDGAVNRLFYEQLHCEWNDFYRASYIFI